MSPRDDGTDPAAAADGGDDRHAAGVREAGVSGAPSNGGRAEGDRLEAAGGEAVGGEAAGGEAAGARVDGVRPEGGDDRHAAGVREAGVSGAPSNGGRAAGGDRAAGGRAGAGAPSDGPDPSAVADDGLGALFDAPAVAGLRAYWAGRGAAVRTQAVEWRESGHSGARLGLIVVGRPDGGDERVVAKLLPAGPDTQEADRHRQALASAPEFAGAHLVDQSYPPVDLPDGRRLMFQRLPPAAGEIMPLAAALNGELAEPCRALVESLFTGWNPVRALRPTTVGEYVATELRSALAPGRSARDWADAVLMADGEAGPRWIRDEDDPGAVLPNPVTITAPDSPLGALPLDRFTGRAHGDLHLGNVLVAREDGRPVPGRHWLIDLAHYQEGVPLSRDVATLVLSLVRRRVAELPPDAAGEARALIDLVIDPSARLGPDIGSGVVDAIRAVDEACREALPGDRAVWRGQYLWSVVAEALVHTSYEAAGPEVRWWYSRLAAHAASAALAELRARGAGEAPSAPDGEVIPIVGFRTGAARSARPRVLRPLAEVVESVRGRFLLPGELPFFAKVPAPRAVPPPRPPGAPRPAGLPGGQRRTSGGRPVPPGGPAVPGGRPVLPKGPAAPGGRPAQPEGPAALGGPVVPGGRPVLSGSPAVPEGPAPGDRPVPSGGPAVPGGRPVPPKGPAAPGGRPAQPGGPAVPNGPAPGDRPVPSGGPAVPGDPAIPRGPAAPAGRPVPRPPNPGPPATAFRPTAFPTPKGSAPEGPASMASAPGDSAPRHPAPPGPAPTGPAAKAVKGPTVKDPAEIRPAGNGPAGKAPVGQGATPLAGAPLPGALVVAAAGVSAQAAPGPRPEALVPVAGAELPAGTVLLGGPGTGKSRWCLEVAARTEEAGSPVFFLGGLDGGSAEPVPLSTEEVVAELAAALAEWDARTAAADSPPPAGPDGRAPRPAALLVLDGLDRFPGLDLSALHDALIDLAYRDRPVALLATCRLGVQWTALRNHRGGAVALPREVRLPSGPEYRRPLLRKVLRAAAPRTVAALGGVGPVLTALGADPDVPPAPAFAAMWAGVLEAAADPAVPPAPSLPEALHRAMGGAPDGGEAAGRPVLLPMAAVLAAAPLPADRLTAVAAAALEATARALERPAPCRAEELVGCLRDLHLLYEDTASGVLALSQPIAGDALLEYAVRHGSEKLGLGTVLGATAGDVGAFANTVVSVARGYPAADQAVRDQADLQIGSWLDEHAEAQGRVLAAVDQGGAGALELLLHAYPWHRLTRELWSPLARPWLERPAVSRVAPMLLARALYEERNEVRERLVAMALAWLRRHAHELVAAEVLRWLLRRHETRGRDRDEALRLADVHLAAHPLVRPNHVLAAALVQQAADPARTGPLAVRALAELRAAPGDETGAPLLAALLSRQDLDERVLADVLELARAHIRRHPLAPSSHQVVKGLLRRSTTTAAEHRAAQAAADAWLEANPLIPHGSHVLSGVLRDRRGTERRRRAAAELAVEWLEHNWRRRPAIWTLTHLMDAQEAAPGTSLLPPELLPRLARVTSLWLLAWGREKVTPDTAARVLRLTHRTEEGGRLAHALLDWVVEHSRRYEAFTALHAVLALSGPGRPLGAQPIGPALQWLRRHHRSADATLVLQELLQVEDINESEARTAYGYALTWLAEHRDRHDTDVHVARRLLTACKRHRPDEEQFAAAVDHVIALLKRLAKDQDISGPSSHTYLPMLRAALELGPDRKRTKRLLKRAWWLYAHSGLTGQRGMLLQSLLGPKDLPADDTAEVIGTALEWLAACAAAEQAGYVLKGLARRREVAGGTEGHRGMCAAARVWFAAHPGHPEAGSLAGLLLARDDLDPETRQAAVEAGTAWLETGPTADKAAPVLLRLLPLTPEGDDRAAAFALRLLRQDPPPPWWRAVLMLSGLLRCAGLTAGQRADVREQALSLAADQLMDRRPGILLQHLLRADGLDEQQLGDAMEHARYWWHHHSLEPSAPYLAEAMFEHREHLRGRLGHRSWYERMVDDLVRWLGASPGGRDNAVRGSLPTAVRLLTGPDGAGPRLAINHQRELAVRVDQWLTARPRDARGTETARRVVALLERTDRADPFGRGVEVPADVLGRLRAAAAS
ncbi:hypothetical protein [Streptomyces sp. ODS05-4]|uniref:hypothetical protein n=1 Tax=Streptomyces sp. ODS05-4 TaxID=2944939 RepID=UPI00210B2867|nr:hypothetical protein [Streptomyces sp. ODS05-4]